MKKYSLSLVSVVALDLEENDGDELALEVRVDGGAIAAHIFTFKTDKNQKTIDLDTTTALEFESMAVFQLVELDWFFLDPLDYFTVQKISQPSVPAGTSKNETLEAFTYSGFGSTAKYMVTIRVSRVAETVETDIKKAIKAFEASDAKSMWPKLTKAAIVQGLKDRVLESSGYTVPEDKVGGPKGAFRVDQAYLNVCQPASVCFELIRRDPEKYVRIVRKLFEVGILLKFGVIGDYEVTTAVREEPFWTAAIATQKWQAVDKKKTFSVDMAQIDWMVLLSMVEAEWVFSPFSLGFTGGTNPWETADLMQDMLGYDYVLVSIALDWAALISDPEEKALAFAEEAVAQGGTGILSFEISMIETALATPGSLAKIAKPDVDARAGGHGGVLLSAVRKPKVSDDLWDNKEYGFDVYSLGARYSVTLSSDQLDDLFRGSISAVE